MASSSGIFTCISCSIAFLTAEEQRCHYSSDFHRYNIKRRVAYLPPVPETIFNQSLLDTNSKYICSRKLTCSLCGKNFSSEGGYSSHIYSRKHKKKELLPYLHCDFDNLYTFSEYTGVAKSSLKAEGCIDPPGTKAIDSLNSDPSPIPANSFKDYANISTLHCLFCRGDYCSVEKNLEHMTIAHSFFIPDKDHLVDLPGLISHLGLKIAVKNTCIYCNESSRLFRSPQAVRNHMKDKSHCKIAYEPDDRSEISRFYVFSSSYPSIARTSVCSGAFTDHHFISNSDSGVEVMSEDSWEVSWGEPGPGNIFPFTELTCDLPLELVLSSGARIGHRSLRKYYDQSFSKMLLGYQKGNNSGPAHIRQLLRDKSSCFVPRMAGYGAFGLGTDIIKAKNPGEARDAGKHVLQFRDQKYRENFKTKVGLIANSQKFFKDSVLQ